MLHLLPLVVILFPAAIGRAQEGGLPRESLSAPAVGRDAGQPALPLVRLESSLIKTQEEKEQGLIDDRRYREFLKKFRADLASEVARMKPTPADVVLHARILSRLGDSGQAVAALRPALDQDPDNATLRLALSQVRYDQKDYPAALAEANAVLERDPANKDALARKHSSEGRIAPGITGGKTGGNASTQMPPPGLGDSWKVPALVSRIQDARRIGDIRGAMASAQELMRADPTSEYAQRIYRGVAREYARTQRVPEPIGDLKLAGDVREEGSNTPAHKGGTPPLWPMLPVAGLGAAAYAVGRSRKTVESEDGFNEIDRPQPGELQRFVAGSILAGLAGAVLYLGGAMVIGAATPLATRLMTGPGQQAMRLARSEAGAIGPRSIQAAEGTALERKVAAEEATEIVRQVVIKRGEILNRVWHSEATSVSRGLSGPIGSSYCRGSCLPINAASALQRRGLEKIPGVAVNNARQGALWRAQEDIVALSRKAIGGIDEEIVLQRADLNKLELIPESISKIPPGR